MRPEKLSKQLREDVTPHLTRRRWILGLSMLGAAMGGIVSLYQMGIIKRLPDPPIPIFDSDKVDAAPYAYSRFNSPDGPIMLISYGITAWLAAMGGKNRARSMPIAPIMLGLKTITDTVVALELAREEYRDAKAFCAYCQIATVASAVSIALALPEMIEAANNLSSQQQASPSERVVERAREIAAEYAR
jgi:hypothetical protein